MTAKELMKELIGTQFFDDPGVDTCKHGDPDKEIKKVAICFNATVNVLKAAKELGTDLLITHECTYYDHMDQRRDDFITQKKYELVSTCPFPIWRFHDHIHHGIGPDGIHEGLIVKSGLSGKYDGHRQWKLDKAITPRKLAAILGENLGVSYPRITGMPDEPIKVIDLYLGACGSAMDAYLSSDAELAIVGEQCEWRNVEQLRDAGQFGIKKSIILLSHGGSEEAGMALLAERVEQTHPELSVHFIPCEEIFTYPNN